MKRKTRSPRRKLSRDSRYRILSSDGPPCPRCSVPMQVRVHPEIGERQLRKPYYYSRWYNCANSACHTALVMPSEFIVWPEERPESVQLSASPGFL